MPRLPAARGALLALLAAALFGASTPLLQRAGSTVGPWLTAALLYAGAALTGWLLRAPVAREAALQRRHWPRLLAMAVCGAAIGPALLAWGLQHTNGTSASLTLTLEAAFTLLLAFVFYHEHIDRRVALAILLLTLGGALLVLDRAASGGSQALGLLAVIAATVTWAVDNTLSRPLADVDPGQVVLGKASIGAAASLLLAALAGDLHWREASGAAALALLLIGAAGYGLSLRFYLLAQRAFGAARTGSVFATAPFIGAAIAFALGERGLSPELLAGAALMLAGVVLHIVERHEHEHLHQALDHEHAHTHDDGHHDHVHEPMPSGPHSHPHHHPALSHRHPHAPDQHHRHEH
jgi:drug/metabolite transporter (DMT)-like permease